VRLLIPGLIEFIAKVAPAVHDGSIIESHAAAVGEVWRAFAALFSLTLEEHRKFFSKNHHLKMRNDVLR
jgi:HEAT repeat-containing protein 5